MPPAFPQSAAPVLAGELWYIFDHVEIDRNSIGIKSDLNDDFSLNLW
ncbi:hypothetical protein SLEP1_g22540 [Rubroshorea leprosula]|uniref:Uncharacterized protein n=1 Tax=Rubroshorea leprosula TaxID=152421 RepID=A0AAV5J9H3_9ROSI|nr:hypothetical protein SLEP1_g22540 [Rubroshorea leprosula]